MTTLSSAPARISAMIERLGRLTRAREAASLAPAQWEALRFLARANSFSRQPGTVATWLATTRGTASQTLKALERKGLIARAPHPRDRRASVLAVSEAGYRLLADDPAQMIVETIARLPPLHAAALSQSLAHILEALAPADEAPIPAPCPGCRHLQPAAAGQGPSCAHFKAPISEEDASLACFFYARPA
jgi:DNA-binding MarR family transcriptional regulator